jgi:hypothetical protein
MEKHRLAPRTNKVESNDRALLKFKIPFSRTFRMFIEKKNLLRKSIFLALQWKSCALENRAIAGVFRQLFNEYLTSSNANFHPTVMNVSACQTATRIERFSSCSCSECLSVSSLSPPSSLFVFYTCACYECLFFGERKGLT